jgi:hypothetical protein
VDEELGAVGLEALDGFWWGGGGWLG